MLPSALPAFSPPSGVRSWPSRPASCGLTAPNATDASSIAATADRISIFMAPPPMCVPGANPSQASERDFDAGRDEIAIVEQVVLAGAAVVGVRDVELPRIVKAGGETHGRVDAAIDESATRTRRNAVHILYPGEVRQQV